MLILSFAASAASAPGQEKSGARKTPTIVFVTGDHEYGSEATMPVLAAELEKRYGFKTTVLKSFPDENAETNIPGLEALAEADLAVFFLRWRQLPPEQIKYIQAYIESGKPVVGFRTTTHAFNYPKGHELEKWNAFGADVFGSPPGWGNGHTHYGHTSSTDVSVIPGASSHPILKGVERSFHLRSWLYHVLPDYPPPGSTRLLMGKSVNPERPNAIDNPVAWTYRTRAGGRSFMTTLGHPEDFRVEAFQRVVVNGIHWALGLPSPDAWKGPMAIEVSYHGIRKTR
jgi:type 1 glutamine amidotransferase